MKSFEIKQNENNLINLYSSLRTKRWKVSIIIKKQFRYAKVQFTVKRWLSGLSVLLRTWPNNVVLFVVSISPALVIKYLRAYEYFISKIVADYRYGFVNNKTTDE